MFTWTPGIKKIFKKFPAYLKMSADLKSVHARAQRTGFFFPKHEQRSSIKIKQLKGRRFEVRRTWKQLMGARPDPQMH